MEENKKYQETLVNLKKILNNDNIGLEKKIKSSEISTLVDDLFKEQKVKEQNEFKNQLRELLKKHVEMTKEIETKKKELVELEKNKQKEFISAAKKLFDSIEDIDNLSNDYCKSLERALDGNDGAELS